MSGVNARIATTKHCATKSARLGARPSVPLTPKSGPAASPLKNVRYVPLADIEIMGAHVRLTPKSRHTQRQSRCPLSAKTCMMLARLAVGTLL